VDAAPDAPALDWDGATATYGELDSRANRLARHLAALGVGPESRVGISLHPGSDVVVAALAVMKAGGCCVPVDTGYPPERMALMLADSGARVLLTRGDLARSAGGAADARVVDLDGEAADITSLPADRLPARARADNLAYVFYTSGSTGRPKGVMMAHGHVVQYAACLPACMPLGPGDRVAQASNASFDAAVFEIWGALLHGATLVGIGRDVLLSAPALGRALREGGVTHLYQTAALFAQHVREKPDVYASLRQLVFGAEAVGTESARRMLAEGRPGRVLHEYGPTEATVWCTLDEVVEVPEGALTVPIGRPVPNARAYVVDRAMCPQPVGVPGELCVGGAGVVRGYLGRPSLTAERFVPDPFAAEPGARMYRTGDRVRWRADGRLEFLGRFDDQVKIRGFRIEPGEVQSALAALPGVRQVRVVVREDRPGDKRLVAYFVGDAEADALAAGVRATLPEYMVPRAFVRMDRLPLNANGKLDRRALPAPHDGAPAYGYVAPRTRTEQALAEIWAEVLDRRVGVRDGFFELGGHSLLAMRAVSRIRARFGVELPVRALFENATVEALARPVDDLVRAGLPQLPAVVPVARDGALPLSFAQERLWFLDRLAQGGAAYNVLQTLRVSGALDAGALERALGEVVRRHEALRTVFRETDGVPAQVVAPFAGFALSVEAVEGGEAAALEAVRADAARPFDLTVGPLFRARLLRLDGDEHLLAMVLHHAVCDGWSMGVLFRELWALYGALREGRPSPLAPLHVQPADHAAWQRAHAGGPDEARQLAYWKERLAGAPELLELPADRPRPPVPSFRGAYVPLHVPAPVLRRLRDVARGEGATLFMTVLAAWQALLARYGGTDDVVVGTPVAGRTRQETEGLVGLFMNTLVLRTRLDGDPGLREAVRRARETVLDAYAHGDVPFERVVAEVQPERSLSRSTLFQVLFQLDDGDDGIAAPDGLALRNVEVDRGTAKLDLTLLLDARADGMRGVLEYGTDLFDPDTAQRMAEHLVRLLDKASAAPDLPLSRVPLAGPTERACVAAWNGTAAPYPADRCIHQLFQAQAARTPDAPAVVCGNETLSYAQLDARANRLAHRLRWHGVGPEVRAAICLERAPELLVALLGVMKAGGAYVPMDPAHPGERMAYTLEDAGVRVLLTQARLAARIPVPAGVETLLLDAAGEDLADEAGDPGVPDSGVTSENLAYVIYTSGSTGRPKGVAMHHRGVSNYVAWGTEAYGTDRGNGAPVFTSMAVDLTITNLLPLFTGLPVHLLPEAEPVEALAAALRRGPPFGLVKITPIHLGLLNTLLAPEELAGAAHTLVIGADFLSAEPTLPWQEHAPGVRLMNEYGPTETVVGCSAYTLPAGVHRHGPVPVGGPIQNLTFHVLDGHGAPVPVGLPGELYIGGAGVARGYLGRPGLTADRFVPNPFAGPGARMYRTGDRARWRADGNLLVLGRTDDQVKVRGYRVELGEIEAVLRGCPGVAEAFVVLREDRPGDRRLVAYVVGAGPGADCAALRDTLRSRLPEYMVPAAFVVLDALPHTPTGKLDRRALPAPAYGAAAAEPGEPEDYLEVQLIQLWEELLGVRGIGPTQGFFDLGGNSFIALRLFALVNRRLECELPLATLFEGATVRHMARALHAQRAVPAGAPAAVVPLQPGGRLPPLFVVHSSDRNVMGYVNLVRHLGPEQPVYGLRDTGDDLGRPLSRIAAEHVASIRAVQPEGPYYLAGWSFGGFVAYEMAAQLEAAGQPVAWVGLVDTMSPVLAQSWPWQSDADLAAGLAEEEAARNRRPVVIPREALEGLDLEAQVRRAVEALRTEGAAAADYDETVLLSQVRTIRDRNRSYAGYSPGSVSAPVVLFRATDPSPRHDAHFASCTNEEKRTLCWSRHAVQPVEVHPVPGGHVTVVAEPHARVLAEGVRRSLAAARARAAAPPVPA
jgi:amino acid adenylation domain-containing protein